MKQLKNTRFWFLVVGLGVLIFFLWVTASFVVANTQTRATSD